MSEVFTPTPAWQEQIFKVLKEGGIQQVSYVPDAGHAHVIRRVNEDPDMRAIVLTTEEEGVAVAGGAWLGGQRHALLMQSQLGFWRPALHRMAYRVTQGKSCRITHLGPASSRTSNKPTRSSPRIRLTHGLRATVEGCGRLMHFQDSLFQK